VSQIEGGYILYTMKKDLFRVKSEEKFIPMKLYIVIRS